MALPASGTLALTTIATEFGDSAPHSMSEFYRGGGKVPDSAGNSAVAASGALNVGGFYNAANRVALAFTIASNTQNYDLFTQVNASPAYAAGTSDITLTVNSGVSVGGTSTYALAIPSAFTAGDTVSIVNNGTVVGRGGNGGNGGPGFVYPGAAGSAASHALNVVFPTTITNNGTLAGGGGGGGGGGGAQTYTTSPKGGSTAYNGTGGGGGGGAGYTAGSGGARGSSGGGPYNALGVAGGAGSATAGGAGGAGGNWAPQPVNGGAGGAGGARGANGGGGGAGYSIRPTKGSGGGGGTAGKYLVGNSYVTFATVGTRLGGVS